MRCRRWIAGVMAAGALVWCASARAQGRGPYLQQGTDEAIVVAWRSDAPEPARVCYGASPDALTDGAGDGAPGTDHAIRIEGLSPSTRYYYASGAEECPPASDGEPNRYFETAPVPGDRVPFRFWLVGDSGTGGSRQAAVRDAMFEHVGDERPDIFVHVGDMAYSDGTTEEFDTKFFAMYEPILENTVCWPAIGNHEGHTSDSASQSGPYYEAYVLPTAGEAGGMPSGTEAYYAFDYANVHFVVLDSYHTSRDPDGAMLRWLDEDLASTDQDWIIAYWHHPPYSKGTHDSDSEGRLVDMRQNALPILEAHGVDLVLAGHSHIYERSHLVGGAYDTPTTAAGHIADMGDGRIDGDGPYDPSGERALYVVAGHGGAGTGGSADHPLMYFSETEHGSCVVDVSGDAITLENVRYDGVVSDRVTLIKSEGLSLLSPVGGERFLAGSTIDITWFSRGDTAAVDLDYSLDAGERWHPIAERIEDDGHHAWDSPARLTREARVRVRDSDDPERSAASAAFELARTATRQVIRFGSVWEYHDEGVDQGTAWRTEYGGWPSGPGQLGYGDGDEATELRDEDPNIPSVYFRHRLELEHEVTAARLRVLYDDGFAAWVNGERVLDRNVEDGVDFDTYASSTSEDNAIAEAELDVSDGPFRAGENIVAVMVKQGNASSSDLSFALALELELRVDELDPPPGEDGGMTAADSGTGADGGDGGDDGGKPGGMDAAAGPDDGGGGCACRAVGPAGGPGGILLALVGLVGARVGRRFSAAARRRRGRRTPRGGASRPGGGHRSARW